MALTTCKVLFQEPYERRVPPLSSCRVLGWMERSISRPQDTYLQRSGVLPLDSSLSKFRMCPTPSRNPSSQGPILACLSRCHVFFFVCLSVCLFL